MRDMPAPTSPSAAPTVDRRSPEPDAISPLCEEALSKLAAFYDGAPTSTTWLGRKYRQALAHYYRHLIPPDASVLEVGCGGGELLMLLPNRDVTGVDVSERQIEAARLKVPHGAFYVQSGESLNLERTFDVIILSETLNYAADVQQLLDRLQRVSKPSTRLLMNFYNSVWRPPISLATTLGLRNSTPQSNWLSSSDIRNLCDLAGWEIIKRQPRVLCPVPIPALATLANRVLAPLLGWFCLTIFCVARPRQATASTDYTVSVVIPARNEAGNISDAIRRMPRMGPRTEVIFVEGHSIDNTWDEIQQVAQANRDWEIITVRQTGKGKGNAVREGFDKATGDILMILDADLTMPPEELPKYYAVLASGRAEFANGVRLVYPMEDKAMRFLNMCANKLFSLGFSWVLDQPIKDTLCGTKVLFRADYCRIAANRSYFGDFDPFGDFDLLFGADKLNLKILDVPIRYRERTYGETNIQRWRHGWLLLRMLAKAALKLKFV
jgi:ubiquinone/menaquinone biosynthesis C-methylase UbiE